MARRKRSKTKHEFSAIFIAAVLLIVISCSRRSSNKTKTEVTPQNIETMVALIMSKTPTATITPMPTDTPLPTKTFTPDPTDTPIPTDTPVSYEAASWLPAVMDSTRKGSWMPSEPEPSYTDGNTYYYQDGSSWTPYTEVPVSYDSNNCYGMIKGNVNPNKETYVYHCPNGQYYDITKIQPEQGDRWFCTELEATAAGFHKPSGDPPCGGL